MGSVLLCYGYNIGGQGEERRYGLCSYQALIKKKCVTIDKGLSCFGNTKDSVY